MPYRFPIYRATETNLRLQIMNALEYSGLAPSIIDPNWSMIVPTGHQLIVYKKIDIEGQVDIQGQVVVI